MKSFGPKVKSELYRHNIDLSTILKVLFLVMKLQDWINLQELKLEARFFFLLNLKINSYWIITFWRIFNCNLKSTIFLFYAFFSFLLFQLIGAGCKNICLSEKAELLVWPNFVFLCVRVIIFCSTDRTVSIKNIVHGR